MQGWRKARAALDFGAPPLPTPELAAKAHANLAQFELDEHDFPAAELYATRCLDQLRALRAAQPGPRFGVASGAPADELAAELRQRLPDAPELAEPPAEAGAAGALASL